MQWFSLIADVVSILSAVFALFAWREAHKIKEEMEKEKARKNRKVTVVLQSGADRLELPIGMNRGEVNRVEILGRLGMLTGKDRFDVGYVKTSDFFRQLTSIIEGDGDAVLMIPCKEDEFKQFVPTKVEPEVAKAS